MPRPKKVTVEEKDQLSSDMESLWDLGNCADDEKAQEDARDILKEQQESRHNSSGDGD